MTGLDADSITDSCTTGGVKWLKLDCKIDLETTNCFLEVWQNTNLMMFSPQRDREREKAGSCGWERGSMQGDRKKCVSVTGFSTISDRVTHHVCRASSFGEDGSA